MNMDELIHSIKRHPVVLSSIPLEAQMGYPVFNLQNGVLRVTCLFNRSKLSGEQVSLYLPRYVIELIYPFKKVARFEDLSLKLNIGSEEFPSPVASYALQTLKQESYRQKLEALVAQGNQILSQYETAQTVPTALLSEYRQLVYQIVPSAFLQLYLNETEL